MAKVKVNRNALVDVVVTAMAVKAEYAGIQTVRAIVDEAKASAFESFDSHPVTAEIEQGPSAEGSALLDGAKGNLFSFIGFTSRTKPLVGIRSLINQINVFGRAKKIIDKKSGNVTLTYNAYIPSPEDFETEAAKKTPNPIGMRSWIHGVENGFDNLHYYLFRRKGFPDKANSRSGTGLQVRNEVSSATFKPMKYTTEISEDISAMLSGLRVQGHRGGFGFANHSKTFAGNFI